MKNPLFFLLDIRYDNSEFRIRVKFNFRYTQEERFFHIPYEKFTMERALELVESMLNTVIIPSDKDIVFIAEDYDCLEEPTLSREYEFLIHAFIKKLPFKNLFVTPEFMNMYHRTLSIDFWDRYSFIHQIKQKTSPIKTIDPRLNVSVQNQLKDLFSQTQSTGFCVEFASAKTNIPSTQKTYVVKDCQELMELSENIKKWEYVIGEMGKERCTDTLKDLAKTCFSIKIEDIDIPDFDLKKDPLDLYKKYLKPSN